MVLGGTASPGGDAGLLVQGGGGVQPAPGTARSSVATLINSSVGAGVLSFPYAFRQLGWAAGVAALVVIAGVEAFTLYVLSRYAEHARCTTYSSLVRKMLGRGPALLMIAVLILYPFGSCVAYLIITGARESRWRSWLPASDATSQLRGLCATSRCRLPAPPPRAPPPRRRLLPAPAAGAVWAGVVHQPCRDHRRRWHNLHAASVLPHAPGRACM